MEQLNNEIAESEIKIAEAEEKYQEIKTEVTSLELQIEDEVR